MQFDSSLSQFQLTWTWSNSAEDYTLKPIEVNGKGHSSSIGLNGI